MQQHSVQPDADGDDPGAGSVVSADVVEEIASCGSSSSAFSLKERLSHFCDRGVGNSGRCGIPDGETASPWWNRVLWFGGGSGMRVAVLDAAHRNSCARGAECDALGYRCLPFRDIYWPLDLAHF